MACPNRCPGSSVPHHCKKISSSGSLRDQVAWLSASILKKRGRQLPVVGPTARRHIVAKTLLAQPLTHPEGSADVHKVVLHEPLVESEVEAVVVVASETIELSGNHDSLTVDKPSNDEWHASQENERSLACCVDETDADDQEQCDLQRPEILERLLLERAPSGPTVTLSQQHYEPQLLRSLPLTDARQAAAQLLFDNVSGLLNNTFTELPTSSSIAAEKWLCDLGSDEACEVVGSLRGSTMGYTSSAMDALAVALHSGAVPLQGLALLISLHEELHSRFGSSCLLASALAARLGWVVEQLEAGTLPFSQWVGLEELRLMLKSLKERSCSFEGAVQLEKSIIAASCKSCRARPPALELCQQCKGSELLPCERCRGSGKYTQPCRTCNGIGQTNRAGHRLHCQRCQGKGAVVLGECRACCNLTTRARPCRACIGGRPLCLECSAQRLKEDKDKAARRRHAPQLPLSERHLGPPDEGVTISRATASDLAWLQRLWQQRADGNIISDVSEAWSIDNPLLSWRFFQRRTELRNVLGRDPDELDGFHGSAVENYLPIVQGGFRSDLRCGQAYGSGEYFAKNPCVSVGYCHSGNYMLVCRLLLGEESSTAKNKDGDHIWVGNCQYYVISSPAQVLPKFLLKFGDSKASKCIELERVLSAGSWSTKKSEKELEAPPNRPCMMSRDSATVLWMGLMRPHIQDEQLDKDVRAFFNLHAPEYCAGLKVQIVKGTFKKAHAILKFPMSRELVHRLNTLPFVEGGLERTICFDDAHGSPEQKCPKWIAKYCRGQNLRYTHPCWCWHPRRETDRAKYSLDFVELTSAKGNEIISKFMSSAPFHNGEPDIVSICAVNNPTLSRLHEEYRQYLKTKHQEEPNVRELYHGTNNNIHDVVFTHGLQPPSDCSPSDLCPVSGGMGLSTTLCPNSCTFCTEKHEWGRCHMFGLGIYLADIAQKSHRYASQPHMSRAGRRRYKMIICSVLGRAFKLEGHLRYPEAMHDLPNIRAVAADELAEFVEPCCAAPRRAGRGGVARRDDITMDAPPEKSDLLFVQGLGSNSRPGSSVYNSEYIAYHPHQCLPKYEITYEI